MLRKILLISTSFLSFVSASVNDTYENDLHEEFPFHSSYYSMGSDIFYRFSHSPKEEMDVVVNQLLLLVNNPGHVEPAPGVTQATCGFMLEIIAFIKIASQHGFDNVLAHDSNCYYTRSQLEQGSEYMDKLYDIMQRINS